VADSELDYAKILKCLLGAWSTILLAFVSALSDYPWKWLGMLPWMQNEREHSSNGNASAAVVGLILLWIISYIVFWVVWAMRPRWKYCRHCGKSRD
jgi:heme/copper-type cytochrome/quinol oxidase subunit 2